MQFNVIIDDVSEVFDDTTECKCQLGNYIKDKIKVYDFNTIIIEKL